MYIIDMLRKKKYSALPKSTVSLIGVVSVLVDGFGLMGQGFLVQLAVHNH